jgi:hypothetical protein
MSASVESGIAQFHWRRRQAIVSSGDKSRFILIYPQQGQQGTGQDDWAFNLGLGPDNSGRVPDNSGLVPHALNISSTKGSGKDFCGPVRSDSFHSLSIISSVLNMCRSQSLNA